jgi:hypothetical protein
MFSFIFAMAAIRMIAISSSPMKSMGSHRSLAMPTSISPIKWKVRALNSSYIQVTEVKDSDEPSLTMSATSPARVFASGLTATLLVHNISQSLAVSLG